MPRIRTVKPILFRHEELQDLEAANPGHHVITVFIALFGHCDREGRFEWKPRQLKLDILPFLDYDLGVSLMLLWENKLVEKYEIDGKLYGLIPTFKKHQRITGKEAVDPPKYPEPKGFLEREKIEKQRGNGRDDRNKEKEIGNRKKENIKRKISLPEGFPFEDDRQRAIEYWQKNGRPDLDVERQAELFTAWAEKNGQKYVDWSAAFRTWYVKALEYNKPPEKKAMGLLS